MCVAAQIAGRAVVGKAAPVSRMINTGSLLSTEDECSSDSRRALVSTDSTCSTACPSWKETALVADNGQDNERETVRGPDVAYMITFASAFFNPKGRMCAGCRKQPLV